MKSEFDFSKKIDDAIRIIDDSMVGKESMGLYSMFSGGHDSLVATHVASHHPLFAGVIHLDTTTGLPETRKFVEETCAELGWALHVGRPYLPYESYLVKFGFPGPAMHYIMYNRLKERPLLGVLKDLKPSGAKRGARFFLASGVRTSESSRRALIKTEPHEDGTRVWVPVIHDWESSHVREYIKWAGLRRSPVKDLLHMSGECFCGAFARQSEFQEISLFYPEQAERIRGWQQIVEIVAKNRKAEVQNGMTPEDQLIDSNHCRWGWSRGASQEQTFMPMCFECRIEE